MAKAGFPQVFFGFFRVLWNFSFFPGFSQFGRVRTPALIQAKKRLTLLFWGRNERLIEKPY